jgi:hypothetical protein
LAAFDVIRAPSFQQLAPEYITFLEVTEARELAHYVVLSTRGAYWSHLKAHACRRMGAPLLVELGESGRRVLDNKIT